MADKNIQIQITTTADTAGAQKAVKIIDEVVDHGKKITPALDTPPGKGLDAIPAKVRPAIEAVDKLVDKAKQVPKALEPTLPVLDNVTKSIFGVQDAAKKAAAELDVLEASRRKSKEAGGALGVDVTDQAGSAIQALAKKNGLGKEASLLASFVSADALAIAGSFTAIGAAAVKSYQLVTSTIAGYSDALKSAQASGVVVDSEFKRQILDMQLEFMPMTTAVDAVIGKVKEFWQICKDPAGELTGLNDFNRIVGESKALMDKLAATRMEKLKADHKELAGDLERQVKALERINEIRAAQGGLAATQAATATKVAGNNGGDVLGGRTNELSVSIDNKLDAIQSKIAMADAEVVTSKEKAREANELWAQETKVGSDSYKAAKQKAEDASVAASESEKNAEKVKELAEIEKQDLIARAQADISDLKTSSADAITKVALAAKEELEKKAATMGDQMSSNAKAALDGLVKIMADGTVKPEELASLQQAMNQMHASREESNSEILKALRLTMSGNDAMKRQVSEMMKKFEVSAYRTR